MLPIRQIIRAFLTGASAQAVVLGLVLALVSSVNGWRWPCLVGLVVSALGELTLENRQPVVARALRTASLGLTVRIVLRLLAALTMTARAGAGAADIALFTAFACLFVAGRTADVLLLAQLRPRRRPAIETRNVALPGLDIPDPPARVLLRGGGAVICLFELLLTVPASLWSDDSTLLGVLAPLGVAGVFALAVVYAVHVLRVGRRLSSDAMRGLIQAFLDEQRPSVLLYSGDSASSAYQVRMWLSTVEKLDEQAVVVLRNRSMVNAIGPTSLPVLCIPAAVDLMSLDLSAIRVALYTANIGNNIHLLRVPGIRSAFIGHGDSDKTASFNPYTRVYDEVWVAGPAGRDRYLTADVGVRDEQIVEVGRPQLDALVALAERRQGHLPTVLYAPTWEGWTDAQSSSSVAEQGLRLAEAALADGSGVRFVYKPHPYTGRRDPQMKAAHERIVSMVAEANRRAGNRSQVSVEWPDVDPLRGVWDPALRTQRSASTAFLPAAGEVEVLRSAAESDYWAALPSSEHVVVTAGGPSLFSCFLESDVLVTDVSSVLSDYQITAKPHAVCNMTDLLGDDFLAAVPSARGATVIDRSGGGVDEILGLARGDIDDARADARAAVRSYLLGDTDQPSFERFQSAVSRLAARAQAHDGTPPTSNGLDGSELSELLEEATDLASQDGDPALVGPDDGRRAGLP